MAAKPARPSELLRVIENRQVWSLAIGLVAVIAKQLGAPIPPDVFKGALAALGLIFADGTFKGTGALVATVLKDLANNPPQG